MPAKERIWTVIICLTLLGSSTIDAIAETFYQSLERKVPDAAAQASLSEALKSIHSVNCDTNTLCSPATKSEIENTPISVGDSKAAMVFGIQSALAEWCGLDYKRGFLPMIAFGQLKKKFNDRQLTFMSFIHGRFYARQLTAYKKSGQTCPASFKEKLNKVLPKLPQSKS